MFEVLNKLINSKKNNKFIDGLSKKYLKKINELEISVSKLSREEICTKISEIRDHNIKTKNVILNEDQICLACAIAREVSNRTIGLRHFDMQIVGGLSLYFGYIAEMKTGEGKTLVATIPVILNYLLNKNVHLITVNDYLAKRDSLWMDPIYVYLNISNSFIQSDQEINEKVKSYSSHVVYGNNNEFCFDYLRDNLRTLNYPKSQSDHRVAIIDEADSVLIDESRSPIGISGPVKTPIKLFKLCYELTENLNVSDVEIKEEKKSVLLNDSGIKKIEFNLKKVNLLKGENLFDSDNLEIYQIINQSLKARFLFEKDKDYVVKDNKIIIVDEFSGRLTEGRRFGDGLHQSLEAKENIQIQAESITLASITFQNYFKLYEKICGMTGTALTEAEEFNQIYGLNVVEIPTNKPMIRNDKNDKIYKTQKEKYQAVINLVKEKYKSGQPVLVGTTSIEKSNIISEMLNGEKIPHNVLNAKNHENEAEIIAAAGKLFQVTVATNMAGRGTDIKLGGVLNDDYPNDQQYKKVLELGGLCILGTERHESRRIDNQLRGRSGRQGDPGESIFFVSLEDDLMRIFGSEKLQGMLSTLGLKEGEVIEHKWLTSSIEKAQKRVEGHNFDIRKQLLEFDNIVNKQRNIIYTKRELIINENILDFIKDTENEFIDNLLEGEESEIDQFVASLPFLNKNYKNDKDHYINTFNILKNTKALNHKQAYEFILKQVCLSIIDKNWQNHIQDINNIKLGVSLSGVGGKDPINEFRKSTFSAFNQAVYEIQKQIVLICNNIDLDKKKDFDEEKKENPYEMKKIGRNEICPCGSGKKYKHCHGKIVTQGV